MPKSCSGGNKRVGTVRYVANKASPKSHEGLVKVVVHEVEDELVLQCVFMTYHVSLCSAQAA